MLNLFKQLIAFQQQQQKTYTHTNTHTLKHTELTYNVLRVRNQYCDVYMQNVCYGALTIIAYSI